MQTFVPDGKSYTDSLKCLDTKRLGNQLWREAKTLINGGWVNHPASKMWKGYRKALALYMICGFDVLEKRTGRKYEEHMDFALDIFSKENWNDLKYPWWWGNERVHSSHRKVLLRKGLEDETYRLAKERLALDLSDFPIKKTNWKASDYERYWGWNGKPNIENTWYGQFGWEEEPAEVDDSGKLPYFWPV